MRRFTHIAGLFLIITLAALPVQAKNCPSKLPANLRQVGEKELYWGLEFRMGSYFVQETDVTTSPSKTTNLFNGFGAVRSIVDFTPEEDFDWINFYFEGELKQRHNVRNCNKWSIKYGDGYDLVPQLRGLSASIDKFDATIKVGRQNLVFGTQAVLDNFFDALVVKKKLSKNFKAQFFAGVLATELTRETLGCGYEQYYEKRKAWKRLCSANYGDYSMAGFSLKYKGFRPHKLSLLDIFQYSRLDVDQEDLSASYPENLSTNFLSLFAMGPLFGSESTFYDAEVIGAYKIYDNKLIPAISMGIRQRFKLGSATLVLHPLYSGSFTPKDENIHFASLFEGYDVGSRQRYGLYDGQIFSMIVRLKYKSVRLFTGYHYHTNRNPTESIDDELEAGFSWFIMGKQKYQLRAIYSLINLAAGELPMSHGARVVLRLIY